MFPALGASAGGGGEASATACHAAKPKYAPSATTRTTCAPDASCTLSATVNHWYVVQLPVVGTGTLASATPSTSTWTRPVVCSELARTSSRYVPASGTRTVYCNHSPVSKLKTS